MTTMNHRKFLRGDIAIPYGQASSTKTFILVLSLILLSFGINALQRSKHQAGDTRVPKNSHELTTNRRLLGLDEKKKKLLVRLAQNSSATQEDGDGSKDKDCTDLHSVENSKKCDFVKTTADCHQSDGFLQYLQFPYCILPKVTVLAFILMFLWLVFLFIVLGTTADEYFCPSLAVISKTLGLSQNVAGVTFLAYGNGAPDIFSALAAFSHAQQSGSAQLGIQALFGAGMFVTTIVVGVVSFTSQLELTNRPFIRDILFYLGAVTWTFVTLYRETIDMKQSIGFIALYAAYVVVVICGRFIYQRYIKKGTVVKVTINATSGEVGPKSLQGFVESASLRGGAPSSSINPAEQKASADSDPGVADGHRVQHHTISDALFATETTLVASALHDTPQPPRVLSRENSQERGDEETPLLGERPSSPRPLRKFLTALVPIDLEEWRQCKVLWKIFLIFKAPAVFFLNLTIPVVDYDEDDHHWNKWLNVLQCITAPVFGVFLTKVNAVLLAERFPVWAMTLCIAVVLALIVAMTTEHDKPPRFHWLFAYLAFVISVIWIYSTANEIVNLLQTFGLAFGLSDAILGLTFLAWGNSIGDFVSNTAMARQGFPQMAVSACYGGPLLNMLLGIGISCTVGTITQGKPIPLLHESHQYLVSAGFLAASLSSSAIVIPLLGFRVPRVFGAYLIVLYVTYLIVSIVVEVKNI